MKKLRFELSPNVGEVLTKDELKQVFGGGSGSGSGSGSGKPCSKRLKCRNCIEISCTGYNYCGYDYNNGLIVGVICEQKSGGYIAKTCPEYS